MVADLRTNQEHHGGRAKILHYVSAPIIVQISCQTATMAEKKCKKNDVL